MINYLLDLNTEISASDSEFQNGYRASAIASLIAGSPYFNGNLKLRGQLIRTNVRNQDPKILKELAKIRTLDVSELTNLDADCNFTRFCSNLTKYIGITGEELLNSQLNIEKVDFSGIYLDLNRLRSAEILDWLRRNRLKIAITNGAKINHFTLTKDLAVALQHFIMDRYTTYWQDGEVIEEKLIPAIITSDMYTIDNTDLLDVTNVNQDLLKLGFKFNPCTLYVTEEPLVQTGIFGNRYKVVCTKLRTESGIECDLDRLETLLDLGCKVNATITSINNWVVRENIINRINYTIPKALSINIENAEEVKKAILLPLDKLEYKKRISFDFLEVDSSSSVTSLYPYVKLGISILKPNKNCFKYQKKLYSKYLKYKEQVSLEKTNG